MDNSRVLKASNFDIPRSLKIRSILSFNPFEISALCVCYLGLESIIQQVDKTKHINHNNKKTFIMQRWIKAKCLK